MIALWSLTFVESSSTENEGDIKEDGICDLQKIKWSRLATLYELFIKGDLKVGGFLLLRLSTT